MRLYGKKTEMHVAVFSFFLKKREMREIEVSGVFHYKNAAFFQ